MAKVTYLNTDGSAPTIEWMGQEFTEGKAVTIDNEALLRKAVNNPSFKVSGSKIEATEAAPQDAPSTDPTPPSGQTYGSSAVINAQNGDTPAQPAESGRRARTTRD